MPAPKPGPAPQAAGEAVDIPPPPRGDDRFEAFLRHERASMIALAVHLGGGELDDPEQAALEGWRRFHPHWPDCDNPPAYLRTCVRSAVYDELRALGDPPVIMRPGDLSGVPGQITAGHGQGLPDQQHQDPVGEAWKSWDPPLVAALARLSDKLRAVVVLDNELNPSERKVPQIAEMLGINRVTAHMRRKRAYDQLGRLLTDSYLEERKERLRDAGGLQERSAP